MKFTDAELATMTFVPVAAIWKMAQVYIGPGSSGRCL
jgi:hypothetical protein